MNILDVLLGNFGSPCILVDFFQVKQLISELKGEDIVKDKSVKEFISKGWARISPVFSPPYIYRLALACTAAMTILTG